MGWLAQLETQAGNAWDNATSSAIDGLFGNQAPASPVQQAAPERVAEIGTVAPKKTIIEQAKALNPLLVGGGLVAVVAVYLMVRK